MLAIVADCMQLRDQVSGAGCQTGNQLLLSGFENLCPEVEQGRQAKAPAPRLQALKNVRQLQANLGIAGGQSVAPDLFQGAAPGERLPQARINHPDMGHAKGRIFFPFLGQAELCGLSPTFRSRTTPSTYSRSGEYDVSRYSFSETRAVTFIASD
jgi:hypothetical protein